MSGHKTEHWCGKNWRDETESAQKASALCDRGVYNYRETTHRIINTHLGEPFELNTTNARTFEIKWNQLKKSALSSVFTVFW